MIEEIEEEVEEEVEEEEEEVRGESHKTIYNKWNGNKKKQRKKKTKPLYGSRLVVVP